MGNLITSRSSFRYFPISCIDSCPLSSYCIRNIHKGVSRNGDQIKTQTKAKTSYHPTHRSFIDHVVGSASLRVPASSIPGLLSVESNHCCHFYRKYGKKAKDNLSAVLHGIDDLRLEQRPIPEISDGEVLIAMDSVGICGSDVHYLTKGRIGHFVVNKPMIIGHESAGVIAKVGCKVKNLAVGDRVAIEPGVPCYKCDHCKQGSYNLCPDMAFCATPPYDGNLAGYYKHVADFCFKLPDHVTMEEGALLEPLSVGVHACNRAGVTLGSKVLILGAGPIGLVTLLVAKSMGATEILITDLVQQRLDVAKELGATHTLLLDPEETAEEITECVHHKLSGGPNMSIDCCGAETTTRLAIFATRSGGVVVVVGMGPPEIKLPLFNALVRELDIRGVFRYCNDYAAALALVASGRVNVKRLVTHHFDISETLKAFETARDSLDGAIKVMIHVQPRDTNNSVKF